MQAPAAWGALVAAPGAAHALPAPQRPAARPARDLAPVAARAQPHEDAAPRAGEAADGGLDDGPRRRSPSTPGSIRATFAQCPHAHPRGVDSTERPRVLLASERLGLSDSNGAFFYRTSASPVAPTQALARGRRRTRGASPPRTRLRMQGDAEKEDSGPGNRHQARWRFNALFTGIRRFSTAINTPTQSGLTRPERRLSGSQNHPQIRRKTQIFKPHPRVFRLDRSRLRAVATKPAR
jgi:hypothetical protein